MNIAYSALVAAGLLLAAPAFANDGPSSTSETKIERQSDGDYKARAKTIEEDTAGTRTTEDSTVKVDTDNDGKVTKKVETTTTTDPKGLMNKEKVKTTDETTVNPDGTGDHSHKREINGKTIEDQKSKIKP